ncbi:alpha/beta hydrolase domain-containing protein [Hypoxylon sp. FL0890]|nr:alpha/beta hydrolase domain-containing protein [Hypoxylon sp. FL0890]
MSAPSPCPFDPELGAMLKAAPPEYTATVTPDTLPALSEAYSKPTQTVDELIGDRPIKAVDYTFPGYQGAEVGITVFTRKVRKSTAKAPAFYYLHGGGMVMGHRFMNAESLLPYVEQFDGVFATVEYRVAPKYPDPVPVEDCYAGLVWLAAQSEKLGFDAKRIMIAGGSAGAGIAAGVTLLARDRGGPHIAWQLLSGPMLDDRNITLSSRQYENLGVWNAKSNQTAWGALLGDKLGGPNVSIYAAPSRALDTKLGLANLPPAFIDVGSAEVFRDEAMAYANGIWAKGGRADLHVWAGGFHAFDMWGHPRLAQEAIAARYNWVRRMVEWDPVSEAFEVPWKSDA